MSNLIMKTEDGGDGYTEIVVNAIDDFSENLTLFQKGNTYTDYGYMRFCILADILGNQDKDTTQIVQALKAIANHWDCVFNDEQEFTTTNEDRNQALINLVQCISAVIGYCWALYDVQSNKIVKPDKE